MTLGFGLFINLSPHSSGAKIIIYQIIAGLGIWPNFQAPLIALQSAIQSCDIATATATFSFTRMLSSAVSIVVGGVIFQSELERRGIRISGPGGALGNVESIHSSELRSQYAIALQRMWILYVCTSASGLVTALFIRRKKLSREHEETRTGLEAQKEIRVEAKQPAEDENPAAD